MRSGTDSTPALRFNKQHQQQEHPCHLTPSIHPQHVSSSDLALEQATHALPQITMPRYVLPISRPTGPVTSTSPILRTIAHKAATHPSGAFYFLSIYWASSYTTLILSLSPLSLITVYPSSKTSLYRETFIVHA